MAESPLREIKPVVVAGQFLVWGPLLSAFVAVIPGVFAFVLSNLFVIGFAGGLGEDPIHAGSGGVVIIYGLIAYLLAFVACMTILGFKAFRTPANTTYTIFPDRIEFEEGFVNYQRRTVVLDQVMDVILHQSALQRKRGAGTIVLIARLGTRAVVLKDVPDPVEVYELIRKLALEKKGKSTS